jgi:hypothetical protein
MVKRVVMAKVSFWLVVIGALVLVLPNPAWPRWAGWAALVVGAILGPAALLAGRRAAPPRRGKSPPPATR